MIIPMLLLAAALSPDGFWVSDGYGLAFEIAGDTLRSFEVTKVSCLPSTTSTAVSTPSGALRAFREQGGPSTLVLLPDNGGERMRLHYNWAASDIVIRRVERLPDLCRQRLSDSPRANFDVFVETWAEQYPFFSMRGVDWSAIVESHRARVSEETSPEDLFALLEGMIAPLDDAHTFILAESPERRFSRTRKSSAWVEPAERERAYRLAEKYLSGPLRSFCEGQLEFGKLSPDISYLRLRSFSGYHADGTFESGLQVLESALDEVFAEAGSWQGFVIDARINWGGSDPYGLAIASRLTDRDYLAYAKQARNDPADPTRWTKEQPSYARPKTRPGFLGPVVELIGIQSISAAETFTQALLHRLPAVVRVGESTQGVFSDILERKLPNGWRFGLPNERFVTDGKSYDGAGIAPDVSVLSFTPEGLASGRDAGIESALELLRAANGAR